MFERLKRAACARIETVRAHVASQSGQSTTEYTLVIVVAATVALLLLNWARGGAITAFFDAMFSKVTTMFA